MVVRISPNDTGAVADAVARAAHTLSQSGVVVLPTETLYGFGVLPAARDKLGAISGRPASEPSTWHAADMASVQAALGFESALHRRVVERLLPGPVRLLVEIGSLGPGRWPIAGLPVGAADAKGTVAIRVPSDPIAAAVIRRVGGVLLIDRVPHEELGGGRSAPGPREGVDLVVDAGTTRYGTRSTTVRLSGTGGGARYEVESAGAASLREVHARIAAKVLFVCTGNTCRSPMAEAIARQRILEQAGGAEIGGLPLLGGIPVQVRSAGVAAEEGASASPQTADALRSVGVDGVGAVGANGPPKHRARGLSASEARDADVIFAMTSSHMKSIASMGPEVAAKVRLIDPSGQDVPDPVGGPVALYISTARRLDALIRERLGQWSRSGVTL